MLMVIFWILFALAALGALRWTVYLFFASLVFGAFNTMPAPFTLMPSAACAPLLVAKVLLSRRGGGELLWDALLNWRRLGLLSAFVALALVVTAAAPALFAGAPTMGLNTLVETPLHYGAGNLTQPIYLIASYCVTVAVYLLVLEPAGRVLLARGLLICAAMAVVAGAADFALGGTSALASLRTATYALLADATMGSMRRVIGFNTEASSYGAMTLAMAAILRFVRPAQVLGGIWPAAEQALVLLLVVFTVLSTSSGAYVGLALMAVAVVGELVVRLVAARDPRARRRGAVELAVLALAGAGVAIVVSSRPDILAALWQQIDAVVLQKTQSDSYIERSSWNHASMAGLWATYGFGLGVGSSRTSGWVVAVVSGPGLAGAALMAAFLARCLVTPPPAGDPALRGMANGARLAWVIAAIPAAGIATAVDFGFFNAVLFAVMAGVPVALRPPVWRAPPPCRAPSIPPAAGAWA